VLGVKYSKWVVIIPPEDIHRLHWNEGQELDVVIKNNELVLKPHKGPEDN